MKNVHILLLILVFLSLTTYSVFALSIDLTSWTPQTRNGSSIVSVTPDEAIFKILRVTPGPKGPQTNSYAFLYSGPISLGEDWGVVIIKGKWWREKGKENYQEMNFYIYAKEPPEFFFAKKTNYIDVSYDTWNHAIRIEDMGVDIETKTKKYIERDIPTSPREFEIIIRNPTPRGEPWWEYWEKNDEEKWEKIYEQEITYMFDGVDYPFSNIFIQIGGWTSWEYPISSTLHFKDLSIKVYTKLELQQGNIEIEPTNTASSQEEATPTPKPPLTEALKEKILSCIPTPDGTIIPFPKVLHKGGSSYRGACGSGKPSTAQNYHDIAIKIPYPPGSNTYYIVLYKNIVKTGTHLGCRFHDTCFDICKEKRGETSQASNYVGPCHDICSGVVVEVYGADLGGAWMLGYGPYDAYILFWGKREVLGPFTEDEAEGAYLKENGIIPQDAEVHNLPSHPLKSLYMIEVWTGKKLLAGTDANIYIELYDKDGNSSGKITLPRAPITRDSLIDAITSNTLSMFSGEGFRVSGFERGNHEKYYFLFGGYVGKIDHIKLWRDNTGVGPDWYCDKIKVYREEWNSFNTTETLGEIKVKSWIGTKPKTFKAK